MIILNGLCIGALFIMGGGLFIILLYLCLMPFDLEDDLLYFLGYHFHTHAFYENYPCLTFEQFLAFYNIAPEKWDIDLSDQVGYRKGCVLIWLYFPTYGDCYKYARWRRKEQKRQRVLKTSKMMNLFLNMVREDSTEYERKAYERANVVYDEILKNLNGEK